MGSHDLGFAVSLREIEIRQVFKDQIFSGEGLLERLAQLSLRASDQDPHNLVLGVTGYGGNGGTGISGAEG